MKLTNVSSSMNDKNALSKSASAKHSSACNSSTQNKHTPLIKWNGIITLGNHADLIILYFNNNYSVRIDLFLERRFYIYLDFLKIDGLYTI